MRAPFIQYGDINTNAPVQMSNVTSFHHKYYGGQQAWVYFETNHKTVTWQFDTNDEAFGLYKLLIEEYC